MELIAVTGIMVILSTILLANYNRFGGAITLRNIVYDVALSIRESQTYGISVRKFGEGAGLFGAGYGVHFEKTSPTQYILFGDAIEADGLYDAGESVDLLTMRGGYHIYDMCATPAGGGADECLLDSLDVLFKRPDPDAFIRVNDLSTLYQKACITIESPRGDQLAVVVWLTGQISIQRTCSAL
ncbi:MAG: hypothetical protein HYT30_02075 [Parcubacteria group bacterium]|nr:hypothetical protein [Parcubacteria group bacterium]